VALAEWDRAHPTPFHGQNGLLWLKTVIVLGIDPGHAVLAGASFAHRQSLLHVAHGVIELDAPSPLPRVSRARAAAHASRFAKHRPSVSSVESLFFHKDAQAAGKARACARVVLLCLARAAFPSPNTRPQDQAHDLPVVAGRQAPGRADVRAALSLEPCHRRTAADALAIAMTHLRLGGLLHALEQATAWTPASASTDSRARVLLALLSKKRPAARRGAAPRLSAGAKFRLGRGPQPVRTYDLEEQITIAREGATHANKPGGRELCGEARHDRPTRPNTARAPRSSQSLTSSIREVSQKTQ